MKRIDTVLFDFDNNLQFGDKEALVAQLIEICERRNMNLSEEYVGSVAHSTPDYVEMKNMLVGEYNKHASIPITVEQFEETNKKVSGMFDDKFYLALGTVEVLAHLKENKYAVGLVTTRGANSLPRLLGEIHHIDHYFDVIVNRTSCTERKPHPRPLFLALELLAQTEKFKGKEFLPKHALYVGDSQYDDVGAARNAGMTSVWNNPAEYVIDAEKGLYKPDYHLKEGMRELKSILSTINREI